MRPHWFYILCAVHDVLIFIQSLKPISNWFYSFELEKKKSVFPHGLVLLWFKYLPWSERRLAKLDFVYLSHINCYRARFPKTLTYFYSYNAHAYAHEIGMPTGFLKPQKHLSDINQPNSKEVSMHYPFPQLYTQVTKYGSLATALCQWVQNRSRMKKKCLFWL